MNKSKQIFIHKHINCEQLLLLHIIKKILDCIHRYRHHCVMFDNEPATRKNTVIYTYYFMYIVIYKNTVYCRICQML